MRRRMTPLSAVLLTVAAGGQIILAILLYNPAGGKVIESLGWGVLWLSALFGWLPVFTLRRHGRVPGGKAYVHTTRLVERGVYAIVRHPQYLAGVLLASVKFIPMSVELSLFPWEGRPDDFTPIGIVPSAFFSFDQYICRELGSAFNWTWH